MRCYQIISWGARQLLHREVSTPAMSVVGANTRDPAKVALAYTVGSRWRNRAEFFQGPEAIEAFLRRKWDKELDYRL
jgi:nuclear transport factor 2 (NTF2) superfamily protein